MLRKHIFLILLCFPFFGLAQGYERNVNDLDSLLVQEQRPIVFFFTADWCKYCKSMKSEVFTNDSVRSLLSNDFYFVEIRESLKKDIIFNQKSYQYIPTGVGTGYHEFLTQYAAREGALSYPTFLIMWNGKEILKFSTTLTKDEFLEVLIEVLKRTIH